MPNHTHTGGGTGGSNTGATWDQHYGGSGHPGVHAGGSAISYSGSGQAHNNMQPYIAYLYCEKG